MVKRLQQTALTIGFAAATPALEVDAFPRRRPLPQGGTDEGQPWRHRRGHRRCLCCLTCVIPAGKQGLLLQPSSAKQGKLESVSDRVSTRRHLLYGRSLLDGLRNAVHAFMKDRPAAMCLKRHGCGHLFCKLPFNQ